MAFIDGCSCRVWALDGWFNDLTAAAVNGRIDALGTGLAINNGGAGLNLSEILVLYKACRVSGPSTAIPCVVYGEFEYQTDVLPTHMWLETGAYIYDTIPGFPLRRKVATPTSRRSPGCVDGVYPPHLIGSFNWFLSPGHVAVLDRAVWNNDEFMP